MPDDETAPECAPPDRETTHRLHWLQQGSSGTSVKKWDSEIGKWWISWANEWKSPEWMAAMGFSYYAPAHPPQPVDAEVVEAVKRAGIKAYEEGDDENAERLQRAYIVLLRGEPDPAGGV